MNRSISMERIYTLGQYKNLKLTDTISDIPEGIAFNAESLALLRQLQMISLDSVYLRYLQESLTFEEDYRKNPQKLEEHLASLQDAKVTTLENLYEAFASEKQA